MTRAILISALMAMLINAAQPAACGEKEESVLRELYKRQDEYYQKWQYLSAREKEDARLLNEEISLYDHEPSQMGLQRIDELKMEIISNLQEQITNDRNYIAHLERQLSRMLDYKFNEMKFKYFGGEASDEQDKNLP